MCSQGFLFFCFFLSQKRQTARHCKNLQIMVTTSYLDIIKSREKNGPTVSNLVHREERSLQSTCKQSYFGSARPDRAEL